VRISEQGLAATSSVPGYRELILVQADLLVDHRRIGILASRRGFLWAWPPAALVDDVGGYLARLDGNRSVEA
jgi:hypothetical protein